MLGPRLLALLVGLLVIGAAEPAHAHQSSVVYLDGRVEGAAFDLEVRIAASDLGEPVAGSPLVVPSRAAALRHAERAGRYVFDRIHVANARASCAYDLGPPSIRDGDRGAPFTFVLHAHYRCTHRIDELGIRDDLFFDLDPQHRALAVVRAFGTTQQLTFGDGHRDAIVRGSRSFAAEFAEYAVLGIEHIFTGYDHLAFLAGLLLVTAGFAWRRGLRETLGVVTAFTVAHSITLVAASLGWVRVSSRVVESAIALSILYVAVENVRAREPRHRWWLAFAFGLVHGFGFATVVSHLGLPRRGFALSLLGFNLGVEIGQLAVVATLFPVLAILAHEPSRRGAREHVVVAALTIAAFALFVLFHVPWRVAAGATGGILAVLTVLARRFGYERGVRRAGSLTIAAFALLWFAERAADHVVFGGRLG
jgi:hypothetical protein